MPSANNTDNYEIMRCCWGCWTWFGLMAIKSAYCTALLPISRQTRASRCKTFLLDSSSSSRNETARTLVGQGMQAFRDGHIAQSIALFDQVESLAPARAPFLWQRGISYYYDNRFDEASKQFRLDAQVNPNDTEEIVWDIASQLKSGRSFPVENQMSLHRQDPRRIMSAVYRLYRGEGLEQELAVAGHSGSRFDEFYAMFYLGLFCEARGEIEKASYYMRQAAKTDYAMSSGRGDYMTDCCKIHCALRGWQ